MSMNKLITYAVFIAASLSVAHGCSCSRSKPDTTVAEEMTVSSADFYAHLDSMPDDGCVRMKINYLGGTLAKVFNDSNHVHLSAAKEIGIEPIDGARKAWAIRHPVTRISSCREYFVDNLTHSVPFLVPEAAALLKEIGRRFNDSLQSRGGGDYRLKVTSVLRTEGAVERLRRRNLNATKESAHQYGTTFDISYAKFICDSVTVPRTQEDLKNLLAEVLKEIRDENKCYVKYERKQGCFHITARSLHSATK